MRASHPDHQRSFWPQFWLRKACRAAGARPNSAPHFRPPETPNSVRQRSQAGGTRSNSACLASWHGSPRAQAAACGGMPLAGPLRRAKLRARGSAEPFDGSTCRHRPPACTGRSVTTSVDNPTYRPSHQSAGAATTGWVPDLTRRVPLSKSARSSQTRPDRPLQQSS